MAEQGSIDPIASAIASKIENHQLQSNRILQDLVIYDRHYRSEPRRRRPDVFANTFVMETFRDVESVGSALESILFADEPWFEIDAMSLDEDAQDRSMITQAVLEQQLEEMQFRTKFSRILRSLVLNGTGVVETFWNFRTKFLPDGKDFKEVSVIDQPDIALVPLANWRFDPFAQTIEDALWVAKEIEVNESELNSLVSASGKLSDQMIKSPDPVPPGNLSTDIGLNVARQLRFGKGFTEIDGKRIVVVDYWGKHPLKETPVDWRIVTVNGNQTVVEIPNPYDHGMKPFLRGTYIDRENSFYAMGVGQILRRPQEEINDFRNLGRDMLNYGLNNMWFRKGPGSSKAKRLKIKPNAIFDVDETGQLEPIKPNLEVLTQLIRFEELTKEDMRFGSAATTTTQALPTGVTATEARIIASESGRRLNSLAISIGESLLKPMLLRMIDLNNQFLDRPMIVKVAGREEKRTIEVNRGDLLLSPIVKIRIATDLDFRPAQNRRLTSTIQTLVQAKQVDPDLQIDIKPLAAKLVKNFGIDPREVIGKSTPPPPPPAPAVAPGGAAESQGILESVLAQRPDLAQAQEQVLNAQGEPIQ